MCSLSMDPAVRSPLHEATAPAGATARRRNLAISIRTPNAVLRVHKRHMRSQTHHLPMRLAASQMPLPFLLRPQFVMSALREMLQDQLATGFALSLTAFVLYKLLRQANGAQSKPPVVSYLVPWIGSAISMSKDPDTSIKNAKYTPVFLLETSG